MSIVISPDEAYVELKCRADGSRQRQELCMEDGSDDAVVVNRIRLRASLVLACSSRSHGVSH